MHFDQNTLTFDYQQTDSETKIIKIIAFFFYFLAFLIGYFSRNILLESFRESDYSTFSIIICIIAFWFLVGTMIYLSKYINPSEPQKVEINRIKNAFMISNQQQDVYEIPFERIAKIDSRVTTICSSGPHSAGTNWNIKKYVITLETKDHLSWDLFITDNQEERQSILDLLQSIISNGAKNYIIPHLQFQSKDIAQIAENTYAWTAKEPALKIYIGFLMILDLFLLGIGFYIKIQGLIALFVLSIIALLLISYLFLGLKKTFPAKCSLKFDKEKIIFSRNKKFTTLKIDQSTFLQYAYYLDFNDTHKNYDVWLYSHDMTINVPFYGKNIINMAKFITSINSQLVH